MLKEIPKEIVIKNKGEYNCRWFRDDYFDLFVWHDGFCKIISIQLYYDIYNNQRALFWKEESGYSIHGVDDGENRPGKPKATPIVVANGRFNGDSIAKEFRKRSIDIDPGVTKFVYQRIIEYSI